MKPAGTERYQSLYFDYPQFEFQRPPELDGAAPLHPVVIVGAGPVGLVAAIELARRGIECVVLDDKGTVNDGSRAICLSRHSLETLAQLGVSEPFLAKALPWTEGRSYYRDEVVYTLRMPHSEHQRFWPMYNLQQQYIEQYLIERVERLAPTVQLRWHSQVVGVENRDDEVRVEVSTPDGTYEMRARYLLAADGARSAVRSALGLRLAGENFPGHYVIADVRMAHDFPTERRAFFESSANPEATVLVHKQPDDLWRVDWQLPEDEDSQAALEENNVRRRVAAILAMIGHTGPWELEWWSIYTANTLCLDDYRHGAVFFIGDSAHIVPIFGVRGLNNGIDDAVNAAWKLAYVLHRRAHGRLLDSYSPERRGATLDVFRNAGRSSRFMTPPSRGYALMRKASLELARSEPFARQLLDPRQVQPYTYVDSTLTVANDSDDRGALASAPGAPLADARIGRADYLLDHLGRGFTGLCFLHEPQPVAALGALSERLRSLDPAFRLVLIAPFSVSEDRAHAVIEDVTGALAQRYGVRASGFYLVRPDRYVVASWTEIDLEAITSTLTSVLGSNLL